MKTNKKPIDCQSAQEIMFDYIDVVASEEDCQALEAHISQCDSCKEELDKRRKMLGLVKSSGGNPPSVLARNVMDKIKYIPQETIKKRLVPSARFVSLASLAACAVIMLAVCFKGIIFADVSMADAADEDTTHYTQIASETFASPNLFDEYADVVSGTSAYKIEDAEAYGLQASWDCSDVLLTDKYDVLPDNGLSVMGGEYDAVVERVYSCVVNDEGKESEIAVVVGYASNFENAFPDCQPTVAVLDGISCNVYDVTENCLDFAYQLISDGADRGSWRVYLPTEFSNLKLILLPD